MLKLVRDNQEESENQPAKEEPPSKQTLSNTALISGILAGEVTAACQFHQRYSDGVNRLVWRLMGEDRDHEDMVQQALIGVISGMQSIKKPESLDAWVKSVTIRVVRDELRRRKRRAFLQRAAPVEEDTAPDPKHPFKQAHIRSFYKILGKLPSDDRLLFVLKHLEGYSNEQVADATNTSLSTAKRRLKRARERFLKEAMTDYSLLTLLGSGNGEF